jgi:hypothetical protein
MSCNFYEEDLALAAVGCLEPSRLRLVQEHCRLCVACGAGLAEYEQIARAHSTKAKELETARVKTRRLISVGSFEASRSLAMPVRMWRWMAPMGMAAVLAVCLYFLRHTKPPPQVAASVHNAPLDRPLRSVAQAQSPSLAAYRQALDDSGEGALDALLARDERHLLPKLSDESLRQLREGL